MQIGRYESRSLRRSTMSIYNADHAWLMLADGTTYEGRSFGAKGTAIGEAVNTCIRSCSTQRDRSRAIIVITDGKNHEYDPV